MAKNNLTNGMKVYWIHTCGLYLRPWKFPALISVRGGSTSLELASKGGRAVNGGAYALFILPTDRLGWLFCDLGEIHVQSFSGIVSPR